MEENSEKTLNTPGEYSFRSAYDSLPKKKLGEARKKIKQILNVTTDKSVYARIAGTPEPKVSEAKAIEQLFRSYGIKVIWGEKSTEE